MSLVYLCKDLRHDRKVAVKVLRQDVGGANRAGGGGCVELCARADDAVAVWANTYDLPPGLLVAVAKSVADSIAAAVLRSR